MPEITQQKKELKHLSRFDLKEGKWVFIGNVVIGSFDSQTLAKFLYERYSDIYIIN